MVHGKHGEALAKVADLGTAGMRRYFAKLFRIIDGAAVRLPKRRTPVELASLTSQAHAAWNRVGVNAFESQELPADASETAKAALRKRHLLSQSLSLDEYRLQRDRAANEAIGRALAKLDRQLTAVFSRI